MLPSRSRLPRVVPPVRPDVQVVIAGRVSRGCVCLRCACWNARSRTSHCSEGGLPVCSFKTVACCIGLAAKVTCEGRVGLTNEARVMTAEWRLGQASAEDFAAPRTGLARATFLHGRWRAGDVAGPRCESCRWRCGSPRVQLPPCGPGAFAATWCRDELARTA